MSEASLLLMGTVTVLGLVAAGLVWWGFSRPRISALLLVCMMFVVGCGRSGKPQAIWCETGTGPAQVVYPRAISYSPDDDTFFIIDRVARVQHLDNHGKCLGEWRMPPCAQGKPV